MTDTTPPRVDPVKELMLKLRLEAERAKGAQEAEHEAWADAKAHPGDQKCLGRYHELRNATNNARWMLSASCSPETILALLARVKALEAEWRGMSQATGDVPPHSTNSLAPPRDPL